MSASENVTENKTLGSPVKEAVSDHGESANTASSKKDRIHPREDDADDITANEAKRKVDLDEVANDLNKEEEKHKDDDDEEGEEDLMPEILPKHFEAAVRNARRSVSDRDLAQYASFAQTLQQSRAAVSSSTGGSLANFSFPTANAAEGGGGAAPAAADDDDEEDLYS